MREVQPQTLLGLSWRRTFVCVHARACLQSYKEADGVYHCEIVFKTDSCCPPVFAAPEGVTGKELEMLTIVLPMGTIFPLWKRNGNL